MEEVKKELISVTSLLREEGFINVAFYDDYGRTRGSYTHDACLYHDTDELDEEVLDPSLLPYFEGWKKFKVDTGFQVYMAEIRLTSEIYKFTGKPDRIGEWPGVGHVILDIKTGSLQAWTALQLAGYRILVREEQDKGHLPPKNYKRFAVNLPGDGTYKVKEYKDRADEGIFLAALAIHNWKKNHGGK